MIFGKKLQIQAVRQMDVSRVSWCSSALLFRVRNGAGALTHRTTKEAGYPDYNYRSQLLLNGRPLIQAHLPV